MGEVDIASSYEGIGIRSGMGIGRAEEEYPGRSRLLPAMGMDDEVEEGDVGEAVRIPACMAEAATVGLPAAISDVEEDVLPLLGVLKIGGNKNPVLPEDPLLNIRVDVDVTGFSDVDRVTGPPASLTTVTGVL